MTAFKQTPKDHGRIKSGTSVHEYFNIRSLLLLYSNTELRVMCINVTNIMSSFNVA